MPIAGKAADKRVQRTRELLLQSLVALIGERGYERLTIQNILDQSGVGRATFYAHFESKDALMELSVAGLRQWLAHEAMSRPNERLGFSLPFFSHLDSHRHIYRMTVGRRGEVTVGRLIRRMLRELTEADLAAHASRVNGAMPTELVTEYIVGALWSTIVWWMTSESELGAAEVDQHFRRLAFSGIPEPATR
ncbi:MAG: TetR/AcrR family transcriptional regulator [Gemmatimonadaceae bacterium]|nr:TetR/AcrR family transcriptional regulator [Gemmatimonadaceae bacterium]